jgi:hypothetical protein
MGSPALGVGDVVVVGDDEVVVVAGDEVELEPTCAPVDFGTVVNGGAVVPPQALAIIARRSSPKPVGRRRLSVPPWFQPPIRRRILGPSRR